MPYDTIIWGEVTQNNGFAGVAAVAGQAPYTSSGDTIKMPSARRVVGMVGTSLTKPNGCRIKGDLSRSADYFYGPASLAPVMSKLRDIALEFQNGEVITAELSNTNVNEESHVSLDVTEEQPHSHPKTIGEAAAKVGAKAVHIIQCTVTVATTKTMFNGEVALDSAASQKTGWLDKTKKYAILGGVMSLSTTAFGTVHIRGLDGAWLGRFPGFVMNKLDGTFEAQGGFSPAYEPIPFAGDKLPLISECGLVAAAHTFGLVIAEL